MKKEETKSRFLKPFPKIDKVLAIIIFLGVFFLGIGYAQISGIDLSVDGVAYAKKQKGIVITNVVFQSSNLADLSCSSILSYYQSNLGSKVCLTSSSESSISYQVTIKNVDTVQKQYVDTYYLDDTYDNPNITFTLDGISTSTILDGGEEVTFTITFHYKDGIEDYHENILNSMLNFKFKDPNSGHSSSGDLVIDFNKGNCWGNVTCQFNVTVTNLNEEYRLKDWQGVYALEGASNCSITSIWDANVTLGEDTLTIKADAPDLNVIEKSSSISSPGFQITCPQEVDFSSGDLSYTLLTDGEGGGETGEGGDSGGTSEDSTTTTKENLTVHFVRSNYWGSGSVYNAQYTVTVSNYTDTNFTNWSFKITLPEGMRIVSGYNYTSTQEGNVVTISPIADWQRTIPVNGSRELGLTFETDDLNKMVTIS